MRHSHRLLAAGCSAALLFLSTTIEAHGPGAPVGGGTRIITGRPSPGIGVAVGTIRITPGGVTFFGGPRGRGTPGGGATGGGPDGAAGTGTPSGGPNGTGTPGAGSTGGGPAGTGTPGAGSTSGGPGGVGSPAGAPAGTGSPSGGAPAAGTTPGGGAGGAAAPGVPRTVTPASGGSPAAPTGPTPVSGAVRKANRLEYDMSWRFWWILNRERYFSERTMNRFDSPDIQRMAERTGSDELMTMTADQVLSSSRDRAQEVLIVLSADPDPVTRGEALIALGKIGAARTGELARQALADGDTGVREAAILALGLRADAAAVEDLVAIANDVEAGRRLCGLTGAVPADDRQAATIALGLAGSLGRKDGLPALVDLMRRGDRDRDLALTAACALGAARAIEAEGPILETIEMRSIKGQVLAAALNALGRIGSRRSLTTLTAALSDKDNEVRRAAAVALGLIALPADDAAVSALASAAEHGRDRVLRELALLSLGRIGGQAAEAVVFRAHGKKGAASEGIVALATGLLAASGRCTDAKSAGERLMLALEHGPSTAAAGAWYVAAGLAKLAESRTVLEKASLSAVDADSREDACLALGLLAQAESAPVLETIFDDATSSAVVRGSAAIALGMTDDPDAAGRLAKAIEFDAPVAMRGASLRRSAAHANAAIVGSIADQLRSPQHFDEYERAFAARSLGILCDRALYSAIARFGEDVEFTGQSAPIRRLLDRF